MFHMRLADGQAGAQASHTQGLPWQRCEDLTRVQHSLVAGRQCMPWHEHVLEGQCGTH